MLEREQVNDLQRRGLDAFVRTVAAASEEAELIEFPGVVGSAVPAVPHRSIANSVAYRSAEELSSALESLATRYRDLGIEAWTVWTPDDDAPARSLLEAAGHRLDAAPASMALELDALADPALDGFDWDDQATPNEVARLNDLAYGMGVDEFTRVLERAPDDSLRLFRARLDGEIAAVCGTIDRDSDCVLAFVATHPDHRGAGLARRLCHAALAEARDRGLRTSTLQATKLGYPVYERLGYETYGTIEMWERREPARQ